MGMRGTMALLASFTERILMKFFITCVVILASSSSYALELVLKKGAQFPHSSRCGYDDCSEFPIGFRFQGADLNCVLALTYYRSIPNMNDSYQITKTTLIELPLFTSKSEYVEKQKCLERDRKGNCLRKEVVTTVLPAFKFSDYHDGAAVFIECLGSEKIARDIEDLDEQTAEAFLKRINHSMIQFP